MSIVRVNVGASVLTVTPRAHVCVCAPGPVFVGPSLREYGEWSEPEVADVFAVLIKKGDVVLDVGANIGKLDSIPDICLDGRSKHNGFDATRLVAAGSTFCFVEQLYPWPND